MHLQFKSSLRRAWRAPGTMQFGISAARGTVLEGVTPDDATFLERLVQGVDSARDQRNRSSSRHDAIVDLLTDADLLVRTRTGRAALGRLGHHRARLAADAAAWSLVHPGDGDGWDVVAARAGRSVLVRGGGRTGLGVATTLAHAGIGTVEVDDARLVTAGDVAACGARLRDVGRPRSEVARATIADHLASPLPSRSPVPPAPRSASGSSGPDLVVLVDHAAADAGRADALVRDDVPHLSVVVRDTDVVVGPLVTPGVGPCLRCLDLHRLDRDPAWGSVLAQLLLPPHATPEAEESAVSVLAAGLSALQVLGHLDGVAIPAAHGATLEVGLPDGLTARRTWPVHAACGCHWRRLEVPADIRRRPPHARGGRTGGPSGENDRRQ